MATLWKFFYSRIFVDDFVTITITCPLILHKYVSNMIDKSLSVKALIIYLGPAKPARVSFYDIIHVYS